MRTSILYIHVFGSFGGSSRSLLEMIGAFSPGSVQPHVVTPKGNVTAIFRKNGIPVIECVGVCKFDNTDYGHYRGRRWAILLREACYVFPTLLALLRARKNWPALDLIHVNDITALPTAILAKLIFRKPVILHVRSVQQPAKDRWRTRFCRFLMRRFCDTVVAIDDTVSQSLPEGTKAHIVHNGFSISSDREEPSPIDPRLAAARNGEIRVAMVGQLHASKGVYEFVEAARLCEERKIAAQFILVGQGSRNLSGLKGALLRRFGFAREVRGDAEALIARHKLQHRILLMGFTADIRSVYRNIDVICFPSHLNAVGRPVFEAAFFGVPCIVAVTNPRSDTFIDGETGLRIEPTPQALANAIEYFYRRPSEIQRMGDRARRLAIEEFSIVNTAKRMLEIYEAEMLAKEGLQTNPIRGNHANTPSDERTDLIHQGELRNE
jgi:glycosyltransferase involved in cell wall biosynthesis